MHEGTSPEEQMKEANVSMLPRDGLLLMVLSLPNENML